MEKAVDLWSDKRHVYLTNLQNVMFHI